MDITFPEHPTLIKSGVFKDARGKFCKIYQGKDHFIKQVNISFTDKKGTVRGVHGSYSKSEAKIVTCIQGVIFDVAIDLDSKSPNFGRTYSAELNSPEESFYIPQGYGHAFQALTDSCILSYLHNSIYNSNDQLNIFPLSSELSKIWQLPVINLSEKDAGAMSLKEYYDDSHNGN